jgi:hypothetical protein
MAIRQKLARPAQPNLHQVVDIFRQGFREAIQKAASAILQADDAANVRSRKFARDFGLALAIHDNDHCDMRTKKVELNGPSGDGEAVRSVNVA